MMISPSAYAEQFRDACYAELIRERESLLAFIREFEAADLASDRSGAEWDIMPRPDAQYQTYLEQLGELCAFMAEKYDREYLWSGRMLGEDKA